MADPKKQISSLVSGHTRVEQAEIEKAIEVPPNPAMGDYALPCFVLAARLKKSPVQIASELSKSLKPGKDFDRVEAKGPYLNFFIRKADLAEKTLKAIAKEKNGYGSLKIKNKNALIEHTSINPNASPHVGRARNALIGDSISRLLRFHGYKTEVHYFVNDVGKQIAFLVLGALKRKKVAFEDLLRIYVKISEKAAKDKNTEKKAFDLLRRLEEGDKAIKKRFLEVVGVCIEGQKRIFADFGIRYDYYDYESKYLWNRGAEKVLATLEKTGKVFVDEHSRKVLDQGAFKLAMKAPVLVLTRGDGTSLYPLRDLAYNIEKIRRGKAVNIIVLGEDHKLYQQQIEAALEVLGYCGPRAIYYTFVLLPEKGKMSTRKGDVVLLSDFMREAKSKAEKEIKKRDKKIRGKKLEEAAKAIGYGAAKFQIIKVSPEKNVTFDWEQALSFEGDTGPYVQYTHARIKSILRKANARPGKADYSALDSEEEKAIIALLADFPAAAKRALDNLKPHLIATYLIALSEKFNAFYHKYPVLKSKENTRQARLALIKGVAQVLKTGLGLIGIEAPERM